MSPPRNVAGEQRWTPPSPPQYHQSTLDERGMMARTGCSAIVAILLAVMATPAPAQYLDPDHCLPCRDKREHFAAGAGLDLLARGPWVARSFRDKPWKRLALTGVVATSWEVL